MAVKLSSPGPMLFRQRRIGQDGQVFEMLKFRSMHIPDDDVEYVPPPGFAPGGVEGPDRRTSIGRFLRRSGLDELPQLINVLRGEMTLVGPRPERPEFAIAFGAELARYTDRHRVKSGITGWAQVSRPARSDLAGRPRRHGQLLHPQLVALARSQDRSTDGPGCAADRQ